MLRFFLITVFLVSIWHISNAAEGCYFSGATTISQGTVSTKAGTYNQNWTFINVTPVYVDCPLPLNSANYHITSENQVYVSGIFGFATAARCRVGTGTYTGYVFTFDVVPCPIDDYIALLLLASGGAGFFILRMRNFKI